MFATAARLKGWVALALVLLVLGGRGANAQPQAPREEPPQPPGATLQSLLELVREANPEVRMAAEEARAAQARTRMAGALMDPTVTLLSSDNMIEGSRLSSPSGDLTVSIQQGIPLGGKRGLAREAAAAGARQQGHLERDMEQDVTMRLKMAFAEQYQVTRVLASMVEIRDLLARLATVAESRYVQGRGMQQDVLMLQADKSMMDADILRMTAERTAMRARINALVARAQDAELADPAALRPLPPDSALVPEALLEKARARNPALAAQAAGVDAAEANRDLMGRAWWPDLMLGFGIMNARDGTRSYEAMVGFTLPLQWDAKNAQIEEAAAMSRAARARLEATRLQQESELGATVATLKAQRDILRVLTTATLPSNEIALRTATTGYELGRGEAMTVLEAVKRLRQVRIELLKVEVEADKRLATLERLIGEDL